MTITKCDGCGVEVDYFAIPFEVRYHHLHILTGKEPESYEISLDHWEASNHTFDLCYKCANRVLIKATQELEQLRIENNLGQVKYAE